MNRADRKAKHRQKREKKRQLIRRQQSGSPTKLFAQGGLVACYMNDDWRERGQAVAFVLRSGRDGRLAMASFIVDLWCAGLKDAWGRIGISRDEFEDTVDRMSAQMDDAIAELPLTEVAQVVAGGVRFARRNGFRLPSHYDKWGSLLGEDFRPESAHLSAFGVDGGTKLRWVGPIGDLRARLVGSTVEDFLSRSDVEAVTGGAMDFEGLDDIVDDDLEDDEEAEATFELLDSMLKHSLASLRRWCFNTGKLPEAKIDDMMPMIIARHLTESADHESRASGESGESGDTNDARGDSSPGRMVANDILSRQQMSLASYPEPERLLMTRAIDQIEEFFKTLRTREEMFEAFGLPSR